MSATVDPQLASPLVEAPITSIQPGGGTCMEIELWWGRLRRAYLRKYRPDYVRRMSELRQGNCAPCTHDVIDPRDLKFYRNVCGYWFRPEDDRFQWRGRLGLARPGLAEIVLLSLVFAFVSTTIVLAGLLGLTHWVVGPGLTIIAILWLFVVLFFRNPRRTIPTDPSAVLSPADGTITDITEMDEPGFADGRAVRVGGVGEAGQRVGVSVPLLDPPRLVAVLLSENFFHLAVGGPPVKPARTAGRQQTTCSE